MNGGGGIDTIVFGDLDSHIRLGSSFHKQFQDTGHGLDKIYTRNIENVITGSGDDIVKGQNLDNVIDTGLGHDSIRGGAGDDILIGGLGDDTIHGGKGVDTIVFEGDVDTQVTLGSWWHNRSQDTGHGLDTIYTKNIENVTTGSGHDQVYGQWFDNVLDSGLGNDEVLGRAGDDTLIGGLGDDILNGGNGVDTLVFGDGDATVNLGGWLHNKVQDTGHGLDTIYTNKTENVTTGSGNDVLQGQHLDNVFISGSGDDVLKGKGGDDTLVGGLGNDELDGGLGSDVFRFGSDDGSDIIKDFDVSEGDKIQLMKTQNDSSDVSYTYDGNDTVVSWENVSIRVESFDDHNQIAQHIEWMIIA